MEIKDQVHELYWKQNINCAGTTLLCLSKLFHIHIEEQTLNAAIGLHGAGGFRAQCGLVEGALMFIGIYFTNKRKSENEIASLCYQYADKFTQKFGSLACYDLRPNGFNQNDPPHACEELTSTAVEFTKQFISDIDDNQLTKNM